ncbi:SH3 domain-containing protein [Jannaschia pohangensis]|uniref:SH3 domain-containing protein n=1 Tax=Jannaschia pohangensis TaxID=390807 RepID=A0A1I3Q4V6_9RHOB|nr:SH3 domain-containing protein [Jannaschia pohangensis]SFJ28983.1 SH3 domain-containing protein [Jannaschia pohangensis]
MLRILSIAATLIAATAAAGAEVVRNDSPFAMALHGGPGTSFRVIGSFPPGARAELGRCVAGGQWCVASTDTTWGWLDVTTVATAGGAATEPPATAVIPDPVITMPLPGAPAGTGTSAVRPLPDAILNAVPGRTLVSVPGAAAPLIFATDRPFYNVSPGPVNLRAGPGTEHPVIATLAPAQGGYLDVCTPAQDWCRIKPLAGDRAWVKMTLVGTRRLTP